MRGIVVCFHGLGLERMFQEETEEGIYYAKAGLLYVMPYNNPWNWMNAQALSYTEEILDVLIAHYGLPETVPIVSMGYSMGGQCAITYCHYAKRTPVVCVTSCPVCDFVFHYTERPDLPRTIYSAMYHEEGTLEQCLRRYSPLHLAGQLPDIPYRIFHCDADQAVNLHTHSERFVQAMEQRGADIVLEVVPDRGHCDLSPEAKARFLGCAVLAVESR